jgi:hypothetical protein
MALGGAIRLVSLCTRPRWWTVTSWFACSVSRLALAPSTAAFEPSSSSWRRGGTAEIRRVLHQQTNFIGMGPENKEEGTCTNADDLSISSEDSDKRIKLPVLKYGYRTEPLEWDELFDIIAVQKDLAKLSRSVEQQRDYEVYKRDLLKIWKSVMDHVLVSKFPGHFVRKIDPEDVSGRGYAVRLYSGEDASVTSLKPNDFPYYTAPNIEHWILWKLGGMLTDKEVEEARKELTEQRLDPDAILHWVNPPHLKSLPDIDHVHIIGRRQQPVDDR